MTDKAKHSGAIWFVRGVEPALRIQVAEAADRASMKVGPWVERALRAALAGSGGTADPVARRVDALEARLAKLERGEVVTVEDGGVEADAPETRAAESADGKRRRKRWTDEDSGILARIAREGGTQADAMRELQKSSGTINARWKSLGLPVEPRKGRVLGPRRKRTA